MFFVSILVTVSPLANNHKYMNAQQTFNITDVLLLRQLLSVNFDQET